jgi:hypothetical protein
MASMLRMSLRVAATVPHPSVSRRVTGLALRHFVRYQSTESSGVDKEKLRAARKAKDDLQRDWTAPIVRYEQVKAKAESPSLVHIAVLFAVVSRD